MVKEDIQVPILSPPNISGARQGRWEGLGRRSDPEEHTGVWAGHRRKKAEPKENRSSPSGPPEIPGAPSCDISSLLRTPQLLHQENQRPFAF